MKDYYIILGVLPDAEDVVIRAAYKALVQRYHPDRFKGDPAEAHRKTHFITHIFFLPYKSMGCRRRGDVDMPK